MPGPRNLRRILYGEYVTPRVENFLGWVGENIRTLLPTCIGFALHSMLREIVTFFVFCFIVVVLTVFSDDIHNSKLPVLFKDY